MGTRNLSDDILVIQQKSGFLVVKVSPHVEGLDHSSGDFLAKLLLTSVEQQEEPLVIIDLNGVELFGSMFLSVLLRCWKACVTRNGMMVLSNTSERVRELLKIVRLDVLWPIYETTEEAINALSTE